MPSARNLWLNLPVKDLKRSKEFYRTIGFRPNPIHAGAEHLTSFLIGEHDFVLMLFPEESFKGFSGNEICDTSKGTEVLLNVDAQTREEVDEMAQIVRDAGGKIFAGPAESDGWMYAFGFADPDGHRWAVLYMDTEKMPDHS